MKNDNIINNLYNNQNIRETIINNNEKNVTNNNIESFKVYIRIRPYSQKDLNISRNNNTNNINLSKTISSPKSLSKSKYPDKTNMLKVEKNILYLEDIKNHKNKNNKIFVFDNVFNETTNNENVFNESIKSMIDKIVEGYNSTAFAYGVTGTGKTYTIFGDLSNNFKDEGIIFKACDYLFEKIALNKNEENNNDINYYIKISYIEIYNEIVKDLINENSNSLIIVEDPQKGVICPNAKEIIINDSIELKKIINESNKRRTMASTNQNQFSSRSHAILQMTLEKKIKKSEDNYEIYFSKFLVVDLAGSERGMEKGKRREEGVNINKSLFTLGNCLNILSEKSNMGKFVPYRDSKLTRLLKDSLGGNILTVMLACISPCPSSYDETLSTLNYAFKAKKITKKVMKNIKEIDINNFQYKEMIDTLKTEIMQLKKIIKNQELKLKEKDTIDKEEINKENISINENKELEKYSNNSNIINQLGINIRENENHVKIDSFNYRDIIDYNQNSKRELNNESDLTIPSIDIYSKEKILPNINQSKSLKDEIDIEKYNKYIEEIVNNDLNLIYLNEQIESIKKDKNTLETFLVKDNIKEEGLVNKYNSIKIIYEKYIEIINEKLVENIEQNMIYNFNIKEIKELNQTNIDKIKELEALKLENGDKNEKITEEINYTNKIILENNTQRDQIYESIKKNNEQKEELKKILLNLLENKVDSVNKYIHILQEKDKLFKITKQYEKQIENYVKLQKQKDEDMVKINRKIEMLRAKLKEKDKKINELEKKGGRTKLEIHNIKSYNTNHNFDKLKINMNGNIKTDHPEKNKSPLKYNKYRMTTFKRQYSKNNNKEKLKSPLNNNEFKKKTNKKSSENNNYEERNNIINSKSFNNNKKRLTIIPTNDNNKLIRKFNKINMTKYQTDNSNNDQINNINDLILQQKYNELIIPKTTITLTENISDKNIEMKQLYYKSSKCNKIKKTASSNVNTFKKYSFVNQQNTKRNSSINNNNDFSRNNKKQSVNSVKNDKNQSNISELNLNHIFSSNKSERSDKSNKSNKNNNVDNNSIIINTFKGEKINIDLTNKDNDNKSENIINDKINNIKSLLLKNDKARKINLNGNNKKAKSKKNYIIKNKQITKISKSNPKITKDKPSTFNQIKKLTLQEARYENKLKYDKIPNGKNELNSAESFLNEYKKMKSKDSLKRKNGSKRANGINNSTLIPLNKIGEMEDDVKSYYIDIQKLKTHKEIMDLNLKNNIKEKKKNGKDDDNYMNNNKNTIVLSVSLNNSK